MRKIKWSGRLRKIGMYLSLFSFIPVIGLEELCDTTVLAIIFTMLRFICCLSALALFIKKGKYSRLMEFIIIFEIWLSCVTIYYHGFDLMLLYGNVITVSACAFFDYQITKNRINFLLKLYRYCCVTVFLNLLSILLVPEGLYLGDLHIARCYYLLGNYNLSIVHILPAVCVGYHLVVERRIKKHDYLILWTVVVATYLLRRSMTSIVGLLIYGVFLLYFNRKAWKFVFNPFVYVVSTMALFCFLVIVQPENLIGSIALSTGKSITFSGRILIWARLISLLSGHWLIGFGIQAPEVLAEAVNFYQAMHAHNLILQVIWQGGLVGAFLLVVMLLFAVKSLLKASDNRIARSYGCALFSLFVMSVADFYEYRAVFSMIVIFSACCVHVCSLKDWAGDIISE